MIAAGARRKTLAHSTLAGVTYQYAATAANGVVQVGVIAVLARLIAPVEFGQVGLATAYIGFWTLIAAFGVGSAEAVIVAAVLSILTVTDVDAVFPARSRTVPLTV